MSSDRDFAILIGRIDQALRQAQRMKMGLLEYILRMALLEVAANCQAEAPAPESARRARLANCDACPDPGDQPD